MTDNDERGQRIAAVEAALNPDMVRANKPTVIAGKEAFDELLADAARRDRDFDALRAFVADVQTACKSVTNAFDNAEYEPEIRSAYQQAYNGLIELGAKAAALSAVDNEGAGT